MSVSGSIRGEPKYYLNMSRNTNQESEFLLREYNHVTQCEPEQSLSIMYESTNTAKQVPKCIPCKSVYQLKRSKVLFSKSDVFAELKTFFWVRWTERKTRQAFIGEKISRAGNLNYANLWKKRDVSFVDSHKIISADFNISTALRVISFVSPIGVATI